MLLTIYLVWIIDYQKWSHLPDLPLGDKIREKVNLGISLDNLHLLKPYEVRSGKDREPYAVYYALGWAIHWTCKPQ